MAITRIYSLVFLVVSVQSQQYGYPYQTGNPYPYPYQTVYNPQNDIVNQQENVSPLNQNYIPYYNSQQPGYYTGYSQNYPYYSFTYPQGHSGQQLQPIPYVYSQSGKPNLPAQYETPQAQPDGGQKFEPIISPTDETKPVDPYANVPTEIIDVDPENFRRIMQHLNAVPTIISYEPRITNGRVRKPHYTVKTESNQYNKTYAPQSILKHQVFSKSYSFNKTYVLHPGQDKNNVINLNFVNGVQVTDAPEDIKKDDDNTSRVEGELTKNGKKFIDVPEGCQDGEGYSATGGCFAPFNLHINETNNHVNTTKNNSTKQNTTVKARIQSNRHYGANY